MMIMIMHALFYTKMLIWNFSSPTPQSAGRNVTPPGSLLRQHVFISLPVDTIFQRLCFLLGLRLTAIKEDMSLGFLVDTISPVFHR